MNTIVAEVRPAESKDAAALAAIHELSWRSAYSGLIPHGALNRMLGRRDAGWWDKAVRHRAAVVVIEFDGRAIGYATLGLNRTQALKVEGEIYELYLLPEFQGVGFGRRIFESARDMLALRGLKGLAVWTLAENQPAMRFYEGMGGTDIAEGSEAFDGRVMRKIAYVWR